MKLDIYMVDEFTNDSKEKRNNGAEERITWAGGDLSIPRITASSNVRYCI